MAYTSTYLYKRRPNPLLVRDKYVTLAGERLYVGFVQNKSVSKTLSAT